jgi:ribosomal protein S18 acetylase RimI-like enzyme
VLEIGLEVRESNSGARAFYAALGFREGGRVPGYYEGREHALELHKRLGPRVS